MRRYTGVGRLSAIAAALSVSIAFGIASRGRAISPMDYLPDGQDLVDQATVEIDGRVSAMQRQGLDARSLFQNIHDLITTLREFAQEQIAPRYPLEAAREFWYQTLMGIDESLREFF